MIAMCCPQSQVRRLAPHGLQPVETKSTAFTLVELLVVLVILTVLASLSLAGLNVGRQTAKRDRTIATIRKLDAIIRPMYEDFLDRRTLLTDLPRLMIYEMPDQWLDVRAENEISALPSQFNTAAARRYSRLIANATQRAAAAQTLSSAECLWLCVTRSGYEPNALEQFRPDEVTDLDGDTFKEFSDGWGNPICFLRWAPGFVSPLSPVQTSTDVNAAKTSTDVGRQLSALTPLIFSAGADGAGTDIVAGDDPYGLQPPTQARTSPYSIFQAGFDSLGAIKAGSTAYRDNITNHDIMVK